MNLTYTVQISANQEGNCTITNIMPLSPVSVSYSRLTFNLSQGMAAFFNLQPDTGEYLLQVDENGDGTTDWQTMPKTAYYQTTKTKGYVVTINEQEFYVSIQSNSTITNFNFCQDEKSIKFYATGISNTFGFCNVTIPKELLRGEPWAVILNGTRKNLKLTQNETHSLICFNYTHVSKYEIVIKGTWVVPEFPSPLTLTIFMLATLIAITLWRIKRNTNFPTFLRIVCSVSHR